MTRLNIRSAFNRIRIASNDEELITFSILMGNYKQKVLLFGLYEELATFQRFVNNTLIKYLNKFYTVYINDILIFSLIRKEHIKYIKAVLSKLQEAGLQVDIRKSEFFIEKTKFLGLIVSKDSLQIDLEKIKVIREQEKPRNLTEVQSFVRFYNFYRRFI